MSTVLESTSRITAPDPRIPQVTFPPDQVMILPLGGMTAAGTPNPWAYSWFQDWTQGAPVSLDTEAPIAELRRRSGLTWDQIGQILGVDRRTLHLWESGRPMRPKHEERLQRVLQVVRKADRGLASATRQVLVEASEGIILKDLLAQGDFQTAWARVEALHPGLPRPVPGPLSPEAKRARRGRPVAQQVPVLDTPVDLPSLGPGRPAKVVRVGRR